MFDTVKQNSVVINKALVDNAKPQKIAKNPTYKEAKSYYTNGNKALSHEDALQRFIYFLQNCYRIQANKPHVKDLETQVHDQISSR